MVRTSCRIWALAGSALLALAGPALSQVQSGPAPSADLEQRNFSITAQALGRAALLFSDQASVQLVLGPQVVDGIRSNEVRGRYTLPAALNTMLAGTGLSWRYLNARVITVERAKSADDRTTPPETGVRTFGAVTVQGQTDAGFADIYSLGRSSGANGSSDPTATQGTGSLTTNGTSVASRFPQPLQQTTQSVSVLTRARLDQQNLTELNSALNQTPGITVVPNNSTDAVFLSRAFPLDSYVVDGGAQVGFTPFAHGSFDLSEYDHIEVLRGSAGQYIGSGQPSGVVSLQRKRPLDHKQLLGEVQGGSFDFYRGEFDVTGPLALDGALRGRAVAAYQDRAFFYDVAHEHKLNLYGVLEGDLDAKTLLRAGGSYGRQIDRGVNQNGLPLYTTGQDLNLPRSTCFCATWARQGVTTVEAFGSLEHKFTSKWLFKADATYKRTREDTLTPTLFGNTLLPGRDSNTLSGSTISSQGTDTQLALSAELSGAFTLFGQEQRLVTGYDYTSDKFLNTSQGYKLNATPNVFGFNPADLGAAPDLTTLINTSRDGSVSRQTGAYGSLTLAILKGLHLGGGIRYTTIELNSAGLREYIFGPLFTFTVPSAVSTRDNYWIPSASLSYDLSDTFTAYGSYNRVVQSQASSLDINGLPLPPSNGNTYEAGLRGAFQDGKLNTSIAGYYIEVKNQASLSGFSPLTDLSYYAPLGKFISKGIDLEITGQVRPGWQVQASYNYNDNKSEFPVSPFSVTSGQVSTQQPKHQVKLWTSFALRNVDAALDAFTFGGGVRVESARSTFGNACIVDPNNPTTCGSFRPFSFTQATHGVGDLFLDYRINRNLTASINLTNIGDVRYYATIGTSSNGNFYGEPRAFSARLRAKL